MTIHTITRISKRARRLSLRVMPYPLRAELVIPSGMGHSQAMAFLESKQPWVSRQATRFPLAIPLQPETIIPVLGREITLKHTGTSRGNSYLEEDCLWVSGFFEHCSERVKRFLTSLLHQELSRKSDEYATRIGKQYRKITVREITSRWGSCSSDGNLSFSWRLVFAPLPVLYYVIAHEVAHLKELNHGPRFWETVHLLCPEYTTHRAWLKQHGMGLHRYS